MTREEAIEQLQNCKDLIKQDGQDYLDERDFPLLDMAIEALSADRPTKHTLPDGTKIPIDEESYEIGYTHGQMADRPTGEWIYLESNHIEKIYLCSNCQNYEAWGETEKTPYCPNCGAKMGGGDK